jgi:Glycosyltransferase family 87
MRLDMPRDRIILLFASLAVMTPLLHFYWPAGNGLDVIGYPLGRDFINVWSGPQIAFGDKVATLFDVRAYHAAIDVLFGQPIPFHNLGYPLFTLPAFWPLAQLPYFWALAVWTFGLFAIFAAVVLSEVGPERRPQALLLLALTPACLINVVGGQNGFLSAALFLGGVLNIDRRPILSGVLIGLLTFKPHLGLVLPFALVALGAWRVIASAAVTALALFLASTAMFGLDAWQEYFSVVGAYQIGLLRHFEGFYTYMMVSVLASLRMAGLPYTISLVIQVLVALSVIAASCWAVRRIADPCGRAFVLAAAALLCTPYGFNYDMTTVGAALVWIMVGRLPQHAEAGPLYTLVWLAPPVAMMLGLLELGLAPLLTLFVLFSMFALAVLPGSRLIPAGRDMASPLLKFQRIMTKARY